MESPVTRWFGQGLRFQCTGCGKCCTGAPGHVFLTEKDLETLAKYFQMTPVQFAKKYCRLVDGKYSLLERSKPYDCIFLRDNRCTVYDARPVQCRTFPWWDENLRTSSDWQETAKYCEGINSDAPLISSHEVEKELTTYLDSLLQQNFSL